MSTRFPVLAAPLTGLVLLLAACGSPAPSDPGSATSTPAAGPTGASDAPPTSTARSTSTTSTTSPTADPESVEPDTSSSDDTDPATAPAPDGDLGPALDAIVPGLGEAGDGPFTEVCGQLSIGSERWLVETVAAGEYAPYVADGFITPEQATRIVDVIEPHCG